MSRKIVVVSGINLFEGGPLSVIKDCLCELNTLDKNKFHIIALVHKIDLFSLDEYKNIEFIEFPYSRKAYLFRMYYEYFYFKKLCRKLNIMYWLSIHDITPRIGKIPQIVYCHNPSIFNSFKWKEVLYQPKQLLFNLFYKYLYAIGIKKNKYIVVQQQWIANEFQSLFKLSKESLLVFNPKIILRNFDHLNNDIGKNDEIITFFYPAFPRAFKNFELICEAVIELNKRSISQFIVKMTLSGAENHYARKIFNKYKHLSNIDFIGLIPREEVFKQYFSSHCLIFPSKLETWGLPISEFKLTEGIILAANLPYAKETVDKYAKVKYFDVNDPIDLANSMQKIIAKDQIIFESSSKSFSDFDKVHSWSELLYKFCLSK